MSRKMDNKMQSDLCRRRLVVADRIKQFYWMLTVGWEEIPGGLLPEQIKQDLALEYGRQLIVQLAEDENQWPDITP